jgi:hypothetical protein
MMRVLVLTLVVALTTAPVALALPREAIVRQWTCNALVPRASLPGGVTLRQPYTSTRGCYPEVLPYTVPADKYLCITSVRFVNKFAGPRSSYFISSIGGVASHAPNVTYPVPLVVTPGHVLTGRFANLSDQDEDQWMTAIIVGYLMPATGVTYDRACQGE